MSVRPVESDLQSDAEVEQWLEELRDRLRGCLPRGKTPCTPVP